MRIGDVIYADRGKYQHYGIYAGNSRVIHHAADSDDFGFNIAVRETSFERFANGDKVSVYDIPQNDTRYSRAETLRRAKSQIGKSDYNILFNNCEHFAIWCKTGKRHSNQVEDAGQEIAEKVVGGIMNVLEHITDGLEEFASSI
jgi:cell wall-associated NlpC family hydrolase